VDVELEDNSTAPETEIEVKEETVKEVKKNLVPRRKKLKSRSKRLAMEIKKLRKTN
jgi:hypothetical protein